MVLAVQSRERRAKGECIVSIYCTYLIHRMHLHSFQLNTQELFIRKQKHEVVYNPKYFTTNARILFMPRCPHFPKKKLKTDILVTVKQLHFLIDFIITISPFQFYQRRCMYRIAYHFPERFQADKLALLRLKFRFKLRLWPLRWFRLIRRCRLYRVYRCLRILSLMCE